MFTGIVEEAAKVRAMELDEAGSGRLSVAAVRALDGLKLGDSIAVNGACLTVVRIHGNGEGGVFAVDLAPETLRKTNLGALKEGDLVNLERPLAVGDRLGGTSSRATWMPPAGCSRPAPRPTACSWDSVLPSG